VFHLQLVRPFPGRTNLLRPLQKLFNLETIQVPVRSQLLEDHCQVGTSLDILYKRAKGGVVKWSLESRPSSTPSLLVRLDLQYTFLPGLAVWRVRSVHTTRKPWQS
jgi:hypothetical protein